VPELQDMIVSTGGSSGKRKMSDVFQDETSEVVPNETPQTPHKNSQKVHVKEESGHVQESQEAIAAESSSGKRKFTLVFHEDQGETHTVKVKRANKVKKPLLSSGDSTEDAGGSSKKMKGKKSSLADSNVPEPGYSPLPTTIDLTAVEKGHPNLFYDVPEEYQFFGKVHLKAKRGRGFDTPRTLNRHTSFRWFYEALKDGRLEAVCNTLSLVGSLREMQKKNMNPWRVEVALIRFSSQGCVCMPGT